MSFSPFNTLSWLFTRASLHVHKIIVFPPSRTPLGEYTNSYTRASNPYFYNIISITLYYQFVVLINNIIKEIFYLNFIENIYILCAHILSERFVRRGIFVESLNFWRNNAENRL